MARIPLYKSDPSRMVRICDALRHGAERATAARNGNVGLDTLLRWCDEDPQIRAQVEAAEHDARSKGVRPSALEPQKRPKREGDRWKIVREDAERANGPGLYGLLLWFEDLLTTKEHKGRPFPPMPPWWRAKFREFWASGKRWFLLRGGRGIGKATMPSRVAVLELMFGPHDFIGAGESAIWPLLSVDMTESNMKVGIVLANLGALGVEPHVVGAGSKNGRTMIAFEDANGTPVEARVYPATVAAMSGPTLAGYTGDEEAKWKHDTDKGTDNAEAVLDAAGPAFRTKPGTHGYRVSSAFVDSGAHYEDIEAGDTALHYVARIGDEFIEQIRADLLRVADAEPSEINADALRKYAAEIDARSPNIPSWLGNPTLTAEGCRQESRTFEAFMREYVSRPSAATGEEIFFDALHLARASSLVLRGEGECFCAIDPGSRRNAFALAIVRRIWTGDGFSFAPVVLRQWIPTPGAPLDLRLVVLPEAAKIARAHRCETWITDAHALTDVEIVGAEHGIATIVRAEGEAFEREGRPVRDGLHRGQVSIGGCEGADELLAQLRGVRTKLTGGRQIMTWPESGDLHGDLARAWVSACAAAGAGQEVEEPMGIATLPGAYQAVDPRMRRAS